MAKDPIGFAGGLTSLYDYVGGDPINLIDPSGLGAWENVCNFILNLFGVAPTMSDIGYEMISNGPDMYRTSWQNYVNSLPADSSTVSVQSYNANMKLQSFNYLAKLLS